MQLIVTAFKGGEKLSSSTIPKFPYTFFFSVFILGFLGLALRWCSNVDSSFLFERDCGLMQLAWVAQSSINVKSVGGLKGPSMNFSISTEIVLEALSEMAFLTAAELAAVTGMPERTARDALLRLYANGYIDAVSHTRSDASRIKRYFLGPTGIEVLAAQRLDGKRPVDIVREQDLTSKEGREFLIARLDVVEVLYRIALDAAALLEDSYDMKFTWRWVRRDALYAMMRLPDGRTVAMSRLGSTHDGDAIRTRFRTLRNMHHRGILYTTLLVVPGPVELVRAMNYLYAADVQGVFIATEAELVTSPLGSSIWHTPGWDTHSLESVLSETPPSSMPSTKRPDDGRTMPSALITEDVSELGMVACELTIPARRIMRALFDFPFISVDKLQLILGFSEGHLGRERALLSKLGLVHRVRIGRTVKQRQRNGVRLVLSNAGRIHLRDVDRSGPSQMASWHVEPHKSGDEELHIPDFLVKGGNAHTLAKQRAHTDGVYAFLALLATCCKTSRTWDLVQALPAHRWERAVKYAPRIKPSRVRPDATIILDHPDGYRSFVLEVERSARSDSTREKKLLPYQRYYASMHTRDDFIDGRPTVLFVYEKREYAAGFATFAAKTRPALPILVSSLDDLEETGRVFGASWLYPWNLDAGKQPLKSLS